MQQGSSESNHQMKLPCIKSKVSAAYTRDDDKKVEAFGWV